VSAPKTSSIGFAIARCAITSRSVLGSVCTENFVHIDLAAQSLNVSDDDYGAMLIADAVRLAVQVEELT